MYFCSVYSQLFISSETDVSCFYKEVMGCEKIKKCVEITQNKEVQNEAICEALGLASILRISMETSNELVIFSKGQINLLKPTGHVMHQQFNIQQLYVLPTLYLCVLYSSENKQRLVPLTA